MCVGYVDTAFYGAVILGFLRECVPASSLLRDSASEPPRDLNGILSKTDWRNIRDNNKLQAILRIGMAAVFSLFAAAVWYLQLFNKFDVFLAQMVANEIARGIIYLIMFHQFLRCFHRMELLLNDFLISRFFGLNRTRLSVYIRNVIGSIVYEVFTEAFYFLALLLIFDATGPWAFVLAWIFTAVLTMQQRISEAPPVPGSDTTLHSLGSNETSQKLRSYCEQVGFPFEQIRIQATAQFSGVATSAALGIGKRRTVVLSDTMFEFLTTDEIVAVTAYEIAQHQLEHNRLRLYQLIFWDAMFWMGFGVFMQWGDVFAAAGIAGAPIHVGYAVYSIMMSPLLAILDVFKYLPWREQEYVADARAVGQIGKAGDLISGLTKMTVANRMSLKGDMTPRRYPSILERIEALKSNPVSQNRLVKPE